MAWIGFSVSFIGMILGVIYLQADLAVKGFFSMAYLFSIMSCFTLAKVIRDKHESERFLHKVEHAKAEKFMSENTALPAS